MPHVWPEDTDFALWELDVLDRDCPACGRALWAANKPQRTVVTLGGLIRLRLQVRSCRHPECPRRGVCLRPVQEGHFALPQHEFGLDVVALVGSLRHAEHRSLPEIHAELVRRGVPICARSVGNLLDRYDELLALSCTDVGRLRRVTSASASVRPSTCRSMGRIPRTSFLSWTFAWRSAS